MLRYARKCCLSTVCTVLLFALFFLTVLPFVPIDKFFVSNYVEYSSIDLKKVTEALPEVPRYTKLIRPLSEINAYSVDVKMKPIEDFRKFETPTDANCTYFEQFQTLPVPAILVDRKILTSMLNNTCEQELGKRKIRIAVDYKLFPESAKIDRDVFGVHFYNTSDETDFLDFDTNVILKNIEYRLIGNLSVPVNIEQYFKIWQRSRIVNCWDRQAGVDEIGNKEAVRNLAMIRDEMVKNNLYPFLAAATMLGWYKECSIIPFVHELEIALLVGELTPEYIEYLLAGKSELMVNRVLGELESSFEMTVKLRNTTAPWTSVFVIYPDVRSDLGNGDIHTYKSGFDGNGWEYRHYSGKYDKFCSTILENHLFWVACETEKLLRIEYDNDWWKTKPGWFYFNKPPLNTIPFIYRNPEARKSVIKYYNFHH